MLRQVRTSFLTSLVISSALLNSIQTRSLFLSFLLIENRGRDSLECVKLFQSYLIGMVNCYWHLGLEFPSYQMPRNKKEKLETKELGERRGRKKKLLLSLRAFVRVGFGVAVSWKATNFFELDRCMLNSEISCKLLLKGVHRFVSLALSFVVEASMKCGHSYMRTDLPDVEIMHVRYSLHFL